MVEDFIQQLRNSKHEFSFIKSIVLQALTRHGWMMERSKLNPNNRKYCPFYRKRTYKDVERKMIKRSNMESWYTSGSLDDPYKQGWKGRVKRKTTQMPKKCQQSTF